MQGHRHTCEHKGRGWSDAAKPETYKGFLASSGRQERDGREGVKLASALTLERQEIMLSFSLWELVIDILGN